MTLKDNVVRPRFEMAVRSFSESSGRGPSSVVQNSNQKAFTGITENTQLKLASSRLDSNIEQERIDEIRNVKNFENGDFPVLRPIYERQVHAHDQ